MTIIEVLVFLKKYRLLISICSAVTALTFLAVSLKIQPSFEASQTIFVKRQASAESKSFYTYDGYYSAQAAERFADSAFGALKSQEFLKLIISQMIYDGRGTVDEKVRAIKVKRLSPQLINLSYSDTDKDKSSLLIENLTRSASDSLLNLNHGGDEGISISLLSDQPIITAHQLSPWLATAAGLLLGIFISLTVSSGHYFLKNLPK